MKNNHLKSLLLNYRQLGLLLKRKTNSDRLRELRLQTAEQLLTWWDRVSPPSCHCPTFHLRAYGVQITPVSITYLVPKRTVESSANMMSFLSPFHQHQNRKRCLLSSGLHRWADHIFLSASFCPHICGSLCSQGTSDNVLCKQHFWAGSVTLQADTPVLTRGFVISTIHLSLPTEGCGSFGKTSVCDEVELLFCTSSRQVAESPERRHNKQNKTKTTKVRFCFTAWPPEILDWCRDWPQMGNN